MLLPDFSFLRDKSTGFGMNKRGEKRKEAAKNERKRTFFQVTCDTTYNN
jgi:hypothetical protein